MQWSRFFRSKREIFHAVRHLIPVIERLYVHRADHLDSLVNQCPNEVPANESARTADNRLSLP